MLMDIWIVYKGNTSVVHFGNTRAAALHLSGKVLSNYIVVKCERPSAPRVVNTTSSANDTGSNSVEELEKQIQAT